MSSLLRPVGPHPPGVYWVRRLVALVLVVAVLLILFWLWGALTGGGGSPSAGPSTSVSTSATGLGSSPPFSSPPASPTPSHSHSPSGSPSAKPTHTGSAKPTSSSKPTTSPNASVKPCADSAITVTASTDAKSYPAGIDPKLSLSVRNTGKTTCTRDVGQIALELRIATAAGAHVWSSDDCAPGGPHDVVTLKPDQVFRTGVVWSRTTSKPGCPGGQPKAPTGSYVLTGRNLTLTSPAVDFQLL
ncbi:MAG TPA: hypothetical protein VMI11_04670 [Actinomycetes bacterium]|nr:hypothetical protein [Actinomycetes bacterium]